MTNPVLIETAQGARHSAELFRWVSSLREILLIRDEDELRYDGSPLSKEFRRRGLKQRTPAAFFDCRRCY